MSMSLSVATVALAPTSRGRLPSTLPGERGDPSRGCGEVTSGASSTRVASVSAEPFEPSVGGRSASSSSSSLDVTSASFASSISGVIDGVSWYSMSQNKPARSLTTKIGASQHMASLLTNLQERGELTFPRPHDLPPRDQPSPHSMPLEVVLCELRIRIVHGLCICIMQLEHRLTQILDGVEVL
jgi:hypothetical protein